MAGVRDARRRSLQAQPLYPLRGGTGDEERGVKRVRRHKAAADRPAGNLLDRLAFSPAAVYRIAGLLTEARIRQNAVDDEIPDRLETAVGLLSGLHVHRRWRRSGFVASASVIQVLSRC